MRGLGRSLGHSGARLHHTIWAHSLFGRSAPGAARGSPGARGDARPNTCAVCVAPGQPPGQPLAAGQQVTRALSQQASSAQADPSATQPPPPRLSALGTSSPPAARPSIRSQTQLSSPFLPRSILPLLPSFLPSSPPPFALPLARTHARTHARTQTLVTCVLVGVCVWRGNTLVINWMQKVHVTAPY